MDSHAMLAGNPGEGVPAGEITDLKSLWSLYKNIESRHPGEQFAVGRSVIEQALSATADVGAVGYRCAMLHILEKLPGDLLTPWKESGQLGDALFSVAARVPMNWIGVDTTCSGLPFDLHAFLDELRREKGQ